eukprot:CAMPEP_0117665738 /NCGR_PEP_ID=MMETSP0804-20121206/9981_1 /TAXON_ID=1074897 /ORGANISM="Tetraselmis astigmatica, Strain CCMP880" /LENGTH=124 /DNA_ID=CAMNT_0005473193 /DNA_START=187 /DNA_END=561 /DNA_ORIENTATION=-
MGSPADEELRSISFFFEVALALLLPAKALAFSAGGGSAPAPPSPLANIMVISIPFFMTGTTCEYGQVWEKPESPRLWWFLMHAMKSWWHFWERTLFAATHLSCFMQHSSTLSQGFSFLQPELQL